MKRLIDHFLLKWKQESTRQPLLLRGARQVGKTYASRTLGKSFTYFVEVNLERDLLAREIFSKTLSPFDMISELSILTKTPIIPGKTLLFIDEIQQVPTAITALRYFYEEMPDLHVLAAGSLLDFAIEQVGLPVGRVTSLYMYPLSFIEFLVAAGHAILAKQIIAHQPTTPFPNSLHEQTWHLLGRYLVIGGMPYAISHWLKTNDPLAIERIQRTLINAYRQDFSSYARTKQVKYVDLVFDHIPLQVGNKFKYSIIDENSRKRELAPALSLLNTAGIAHKVIACAGQGPPLLAQSKPGDYKVLFLDIGLTQAALGLEQSPWLINPRQETCNKGATIEAFVGQEIAAYSRPFSSARLFYWRKQQPNSSAEVDYLTVQDQCVIPIEVKAGTGTALKSMRAFLASHPNSPYGIRFSTHNFSVHEQLHSYPLYAVAQLAQNDPIINKALFWLTDTSATPS